MTARNAFYAQSGGVTAVINTTAAGVIETARKHPRQFANVYAGRNGIIGALTEDMIDTNKESARAIAALKHTPGGAFGSARYKLKGIDENRAEYERLIDVFRAHDIGYFFYNGGNDSMDTAHKIAEIAREQGIEVISTGVPKTIDNDVGDSEFKLIDHTPGYGSTARYWSCIVQNANEENRGSCPADPVLILQAMGRKIGYIPAAARLADPNREMPLQIYMAESGHTLESLAENVNRQLKQDGRCIVVVSEGFDVGDLGEVKDAFGHTEFSSSQMTVAQKVVNYLNAQGLPVPGSARCQVPGTDQRSMSIYASVTDIAEAYEVGRKAVEVAVKDGNGWMATILREPGDAYNVYYDKVPLELVANSERTFPKEWISKDGLDVTDDFLRYVRPLIGDQWPAIQLENGLQRYTRFSPLFAAKKLQLYTPEACR
jgi:6-phosphofructokinase